MFNPVEPASPAFTMSWRNASSTYPSISLAWAQPVCLHHVCILLASLMWFALAYPPRDPQAGAWFRASLNETQETTQHRCHAFLHALLFTTLSHLREICDEEAVAQKMQTEPPLATLASEFRDRMAKGRTFEAHGAYRTNFYDAVFAQAHKVTPPSFPRIQFLMSPSEYGGDF